MSEKLSNRLSNRIRPTTEAEPWVVDEVEDLETEIDRLRATTIPREDVERVIDEVEKKNGTWIATWLRRQLLGEADDEK